MDSFVASAASVAGRSEVPRQLLEPMPRQLELVEEVIERERRLQRELAGQLVAPVEAVFDLLEQGGATLRRQAEALEAAGRGDEETAGLMKSQAELVERTIGTLRQPAALAKVEMALDGGRASAAAADPAADHGHRRRSTPCWGLRPRLLDLQRIDNAEIISTVGSRLRARARSSRCGNQRPTRRCSLRRRQKPGKARSTLPRRARRERALRRCGCQGQYCGLGSSAGGVPMDLSSMKGRAVSRPTSRAPGGSWPRP
jgi:hypothetical protein